MLPHVGMVKTYPRCPEAGMYVDLGCYNLMKYIPFLVPEVFYWLTFQCNCNYICFQRHSAPFLLHLYILLLWKRYYSQRSYTFYGVQAACEMNTCTNMTFSDVIEAHATVLN